jgi:hypothetical protein
MPMRWLASLVFLAALVGGRASAQPAAWDLSENSRPGCLLDDDTVFKLLLPHRTIAEEILDRTGLSVHLRMAQMLGILEEVERQRKAREVDPDGGTKGP